MKNKNTTRAIKDDDYEKYLVDMKELPTTDSGNEQGNKTPKESLVPKKTVNTEPVSDQILVKPENKAVAKSFKPPVDLPGEVNNKYYSRKDLALGFINLIAVFGLLIILSKIPSKVDEYKKLRSELQILTESPEVGEHQITQNAEKYQKLENAFLGETDIVNFVNDIESIKKEGTTISKVTFTSEKPVLDKTGNNGYPLIIEFTGTWENISRDLEKVDELPYLFRAVSFNSGKNILDNMILLKYGGILYVKDIRKN